MRNIRIYQYLFIPLFILLSSAALLAQFDEPPKAETAASVGTWSLVPGKETTLSVTYLIPDGVKQTLQEEYFYFSIEENEQFTLGEIKYPDGKIEDGVVYYYDSVTLTAPLRAVDTAAPGEYDVKVTAAYQLCNAEGVCFFPEQTEIGLTLQVTEAVQAPEPLGILTILRFILFAFIGGVLLNIMPCVFPLLSVRALSLVRESQNDRKRIFLGSMSYTGGILVSFIILAVIVVAVKASGELVGWGFQFQNPGFVIALTAIIYVFALSMFDLYVITAPGSTAAAKASSRGGYAGSFLTGVFAVLVATPCTAPFLGSALGFAFSQPPLVIFLIFIFVGVGLALPFILLGIWPGIIKRIPKPGPWMNTFKEVMGFLLIGTAIYLLNTLYSQLGGGVIRVIIFLAILTFSVWLYGRFAGLNASRRRRWLVIAAAIVISVAGGIYTLDFNGTENPGVQTKTAQKAKDGWETFSPELVEKYRNEGYPVFIDFYAEWCTNCKVNEARVLSTDEVLSAFKEKDVKLLIGDFTLNDPVIAEWIKKFGKAGVPVYALYLPGETEPIIFPELLSKNMVIEAISGS